MKPTFVVLFITLQLYQVSDGRGFHNPCKTEEKHSGRQFSPCTYRLNIHDSSVDAITVNVMFSLTSRRQNSWIVALPANFQVPFNISLLREDGTSQILHLATKSRADIVFPIARLVSENRLLKLIILLQGVRAVRTPSQMQGARKYSFGSDARHRKMSRRLSQISKVRLAPGSNSSFARPERNEDRPFTSKMRSKACLELKILCLRRRECSIHLQTYGKQEERSSLFVLGAVLCVGGFVILFVSVLVIVRWTSRHFSERNDGDSSSG